MEEIESLFSLGRERIVYKEVCGTTYTDPIRGTTTRSVTKIQETNVHMNTSLHSPPLVGAQRSIMPSLPRSNS